MIVVKLMGGLGNQMFQYAFSRELAKMYGENVYYDIDSYSSDKLRSLALYNLSVQELPNWNEAFTKSERNKIIREQKVYRVIQRIMRALHRSDRVGERLYNKYLKKGRYYNFDPYFYSLPKLNSYNKFAYGYFQGEPYFRNVIQEIKQAFIVSKPIDNEFYILKHIESCNSVCIHLRVGDYKDPKNKRFDVLTPEYVIRGIDYIKKHVENPVFFLFTNDPVAVKAQYNIEQAIFVNGFKDYQDMRLMMSCKHFIISNSTFSWWASYLADNQNKLIIVPEKWRNNQETEPALMNCKEYNYIKL